MRIRTHGGGWEKADPDFFFCHANEWIKMKQVKEELNASFIHHHATHTLGNYTRDWPRISLSWLFPNGTSSQSPHSLKGWWEFVPKISARDLGAPQKAAIAQGRGST